MSEPKPLQVADNRPRYTFTIPAFARVYAEDPSSVTMVPVRVADEVEALKVSEASNTGMAGYLNEVVRRSVVAVDGKAVTWDAGGADWIEKCSPGVRSLIKRGYNKIHTPAETAFDSFLASMTVASG